MSVDPRIVATFIVNACPDHHVRDGTSHIAVKQTAMSIVRRHPDIASASLEAAIVCGNVDAVERILRADPGAASRPLGPKGSAEAQGDHLVMEPSPPGDPLWEPLHYLCFARLDRPETNENAIEIARRLLDLGANPNAFFMAGGSRYTPLVGVLGAGEENRRSHPAREALARLLLERGADPFDGQVFYNIRFTRDPIWYLNLAYEESVKRGRQADWDDPEWRMIDMGGYGFGARWLLTGALERDSLALADWLLSHGATPTPAVPPKPNAATSVDLWNASMSVGFTEFADLLVRHGAQPGQRPSDDEGAFTAAVLRLDRDAASRILSAHPEYLRSSRPIRKAAELDRPEAIALLLDLGTSIEVENDQHQRALHFAAWSDAHRAAAYLIERGAEIDPRESQWGNTPLSFALYGQQDRMIDRLAAHSRDVWSLVTTGKVDRLQIVLEENPSLARVSWNGAIPLTWLPGDERRALEIVKLFLDHGADVTQRFEGLTPAEWARKRWLTDAADLPDASEEVQRRE